MNRIAIQTVGSKAGWVATVTVTDSVSSRTFEVAVTEAEVAHLDAGAAGPEGLIARTFEFLLAREPKESILPKFDLQVVGRYFPEFEQEIRR